jgi:hypothetical protein
MVVWLIASAPNANEIKLIFENVGMFRPKGSLLTKIR